MRWCFPLVLVFCLSNGTAFAAAEPDPNYRALREASLAETYTVNNLILERDVGKFALRSGRIRFLTPVLSRVAIGVFVGEGEFTLTPSPGIESDYLRLITNKEGVKEPFQRLVLCFTDETYDEIKRQAQATDEEARASDVLRDFRNRIRRRPEEPRSLIEALLTDESMDNVEADILADLYNPRRHGFFRAYIFGRSHGDLRYLVHPLGALPQLPAPEEVALINLDPGGDEEGIWYLAHSNSEIRSGLAGSEEDKRVIDAQHYRIETEVDGGGKLAAKTELSFRALSDGERILKLGLLPSLRVSRVLLGDREIRFIQEKEREDGSFHIVLPDPLVKDQQYKVSIEYEGRKVIRKEGGGNFAVGARTSWYPSVNAFADRATFDLSFKVPKDFTLVGVGKRVQESREGNQVASQWISDNPLAVAGFNYGRFKKKEVTDEVIKYKIEGYATSDLPDYLHGAGDIGGMSPTRLMESAMAEAQNSMRLYTRWFGEAPYGRLAITQQPEFAFGQSWPTLVYLPISAFFDSTQRWMMLGENSSKFAEFIQEVTPHEVAHQWWGHMVGWASHHDQWLSEGFADFSASLYLQLIEQNQGKYWKFWEHNRDAILNRGQFGRRPNDAGPIWMGLRLNTHRTPGAYSRLVYPKGGYILHMLRYLMYDDKTGDQPFIAMMRDFVATYLHKNASTEGFKRVVEKHMHAGMDLDGNHKMDWFFNQWVYGTEVPRYRLDYSLATGDDGKVLLTGAITQQGVSDGFKMVVPVYLDFDGKLMRLGVAGVQGNSTTPEFKVALPKRPKRVLINANFDVLAYESASRAK